jgi:hypothetical protein
MPLDLDKITTVLNQLYAPVVAIQLNDRSPFLARVAKNIGGGKNIAWDVKLKRGTSAASYASGANITGDDYRLEKPATLNWKRLKSEFQVAGDALAAAATGGPAAYANLLGKEIMDAARDLAIETGKQLYGDGTGNAGKDLDGLAAIVANTGTYAGIDRAVADHAQWKATVLANGGVDRALTVDLMREAERKVFEASGFPPDFIITTPAIYAKYEALFDSPKRLTIGQSEYDLGASQLAFKGIPIIRDPQCPAKTMYFLTKDSIDFIQLPPVITDAGLELTQGSQPLTTADGAIGLQVAIELLGKSGDAYKGFLKLYGNLRGTNPNRNAIIKDIQES